MGGIGSGRLNKTDAMLKTHREVRIPIAHVGFGDDMFLPNYSGVQKTALKGRTALLGAFMGTNLGGSLSSSEIAVFWTISGPKGEDTDEDDVIQVAPHALTISNVRIRIEVNTLDKEITWLTRVNKSSATNIRITIAASTAGAFSNTTDKDTFAAADLINYATVHDAGGSGSATHFGWGCSHTLSE